MHRYRNREYKAGRILRIMRPIRAVIDSVAHIPAESEVNLLRDTDIGQVSIWLLSGQSRVSRYIPHRQSVSPSFNSLSKLSSLSILGVIMIEWRRWSLNLVRAFGAVIPSNVGTSNHVGNLVRIEFVIALQASVGYHACSLTGCSRKNLPDY
jgi:hypothetical protein